MRKLHFIDISICIILLGIAIFLFYNDFSNANIVRGYYLFDKVKDLLFMISLAFLLKGTRRKCAFVASMFLLCRVIWQVFEFENEIKSNEVHIIDLLFCLAMVCNLFIIFKSNIKPTR